MINTHLAAGLIGVHTIPISIHLVIIVSLAVLHTPTRCFLGRKEKKKNIKEEFEELGLYCFISGLLSFLGMKNIIGELKLLTNDSTCLLYTSDAADE